MNEWNKRFNDVNYVYGKEPNAFIKEAYEKYSFTGNTLAIAEGEGRNAVYLAEKGLNVTAWDYSLEGLRKTNELALERGVQVATKLVDLKEANWEEHKWDQIICVFGHFEEELRTKTLNDVKKAIKPGGYYITEVYSHHQLAYNSAGPRTQELLYTPEEFLTVFHDWKLQEK